MLTKDEIDQKIAQLQEGLDRRIRDLACYSTGGDIFNLRRDIAELRQMSRELDPTDTLNWRIKATDQYGRAQ